MNNLAAWLLEQIAADEEVARAAMPGPWFSTEHELWASPIVCENHWPGLTEEEAEEYGEVPGPLHYVVAQTMHGGRKLADAAHIAHWDPARVLAECAAKRAIVEHVKEQWDAAYGEPDLFLPREWETVLRLLAQPYADRPGWREEWSVQ